jgi:hypothetical protein
VVEKKHTSLLRKNKKNRPGGGVLPAPRQVKRKLNSGEYYITLED